MSRKKIYFALLFLAATLCHAQQQKRVLFIGNSYTSFNNLPSLIEHIAAQMGDSMAWERNTPGGCTFKQHCSNQSMQLICQGGWDAVVLQEQSQYPSFTQDIVESDVFPYAERLVDSAYANSPCCEPIFYMTWGRKNGDQINAQYFSVLGTYEGMDSMLCLRYTYMAHANDASLCPVGRVWHHLRDNNPEIELYQDDESHPSLAGSYAAACAFYVLLFHRDPDSITYSSTLPDETARTIRSTVHEVVFDSLQQWQRPEPSVAYQARVDIDSTVLFTSVALHADSLLWLFGDGTDTLLGSEQQTVVHQYSDTGSFLVSVVASRHCMTDTFSSTICIEPTETVAISPLQEYSIRVSPNPASDNIVVHSDSCNSPVTCQLYSMSGTLLFSVTTPLPATIPLSTFPKGSYLLRLISPSNAASQRVIVIQ